MNGQKPDILTRIETRRLASTNLDHSLRYPAPQSLLWLKAPHMPWVLVKMEDAA